MDETSTAESISPASATSTTPSDASRSSRAEATTTPHWQHLGNARITLADWRDAADDLRTTGGVIDLCYADPPFNTGTDQRGAASTYADRFDSIDHYLDWLAQRLDATIPLLKPTGNLLLHVDWRTAHRVRVLLDDRLGPDRFVNHLIWSYGLGGSSPRRFARKHDDILFYCVDPDRYHFEPPMVPSSSRRMEGRPKKATDVLDIPAINNMARERTGYPTQKPRALLDLLVNACCPPGGTVLDPCFGSGTTLVAAVAGGRHAIGADLNPDALTIATHRLEELRQEPTGSDDRE